MTVADNVRSIAQEAEPIIERWLDAAEELADIRDAASEKGISWTQLKAVLVAKIKDNKDGGDRLKEMTRKDDLRLSYADMISMAPIVAEQKRTSPQLEIVSRETQPVPVKSSPPSARDSDGAAVSVRCGADTAASNSVQGSGEGPPATNATELAAPLVATAGDGEGPIGAVATLDDPYNADIRTTIFNRTGALI